MTPIETQDVEKFMEWLAIRFREHRGYESQGRYQLAIGQMWYMLYELMCHYCTPNDYTNSNYRKLALQWRREVYGVISLNYDVLFELALCSAQGAYYAPTNTFQPNAIPIAKVHVSINWL